MEDLLIFTYGSLMRGFGNHYTMLNANGEFVKEDSIKGVRLHAYCSSFPGATKGTENDFTKGEVYRVPRSGLIGLDRLESEGFFYHRHNMTTESGDEVQVYLLKKADVRGEHIESGCWRVHKQRFINNDRYEDSIRQWRKKLYYRIRR